MASQVGLLSLPTEILQHILTILSTPSFVQLSTSCKALFELAQNSRGVILHHLRSVPGIKIGLDDPTVATADLFLLFRQRASKHLYGANFNANCLELRARNTLINADASCITASFLETGKISLVTKDSQTVRLYDNDCTLTDAITSPFCGGIVTVLQVAHITDLIAVLYQWESEKKQKTPPWIEKALVQDHPHKKPYDLSTNSASDIDSNTAPDDGETEPPKVKPTKIYHLQFFDLVRREKVKAFTISQHKDLVPRHIALSTRLLWAILWDSDDSRLPTDKSEIVQYSVPKWTLLDVPGDVPQTRELWPTESDPRPLAATPDELDKGYTVRNASRITYFKDGRRLSLYAPGDIVPFKVISAGNSREYRSPTNSIYFENQTTFLVNTSFFGIHESYQDIDEQQEFCNTTYLCLGVGNVCHGSGSCKILCILRSRSKTDHDDCPHSIDLNRMNHVTAENCKAVARLWGWQETLTSLTGLDTVAVSPRGTRIAVAEWNRVLIWSLDPKMLCEDIVDFDSDDDTRKSDRKKANRTKSIAEGFYERQKDNLMGWKLANLIPIVVDLGGAIARKMTWKTSYEIEDHDSSDGEGNDEGGSTPLLKADPASPSSQHSGSVSDAVIEKKSTQIDQVKLTTEADHTPVHGTTSIEDTVVSDSKSRKPQMDATTSAAESRSPQLSTGVENPTTTTVRTPPKRSIPAPSAQLQQSSTRLQPASTLKADTAEIIVDHAEDSNIASDTPISVVEQSSPLIIEPPPSPLDQSLRGPKGKEKQTDSHCHDLSPLSSVFKDTRADNKTGTSTTKPTSKKRRMKRLTEDRLVILTDRGFQVWDFGVWSKGVRRKRWLEEQ